MLLTDSRSIRDVLLFPTMKPLDKKPEAPSATKAAEAQNAGAAEAAASRRRWRKIDFSKVEIEPLFAGRRGL